MSEDNKIVPEHYQEHSITEIEHFEDHGQRKETKYFRQAKHQLERVDNVGCKVCGTKGKRESHHIVERASWLGADLQKVAHYLYNHWDYHGYCHKEFKSEEELFTFFMNNFNGRQVTEKDEETGEDITYYTCDDDGADTIFNQLILCEKHHRGEGTSAHGSTFATMCAIVVSRKGFEASISPKELEERIKQHHIEKHGNLIVPVENKEE